MLQAMWTVTAKDDQKLMVIKSDSTLDRHSIEDMLRQIYMTDTGKYASYDRFADLSNVKDIDVDIDAVVATVRFYRQLKLPTKKVKVAVHLSFGMTGSLAQIYRLLTEHDTLFDVQIFHSVEECAEFLQVDQSLLG